MATVITVLLALRLGAVDGYSRPLSGLHQRGITKRSRLSFRFHATAAERSEEEYVDAAAALESVRGDNAIILDVREMGELTFSGAVGLSEEVYVHVPVMRWEHG